MEQKKIIIRKPSEHGGGVRQSRQDNLKILESTVKKLKNRFTQFGFNDSKEQSFFEENVNKEIVLELSGRDQEGLLESIDKYRIGIIIDGKQSYFYKHAITGYYVK